MSDWVVYGKNLLAGLTTIGGSGVDGVTDTSATGTAPWAVDWNSTTLWTPTLSGSGAKSLRVNLPSLVAAEIVDAVFLDNLQGVSGTLNVYTRGTYSGGTTLRGTASFPAGLRSVLLRLNTPVASEFWDVELATTSTATKVGEVGLMAQSGRIPFSDSAPERPIARVYSPGAVALRSAGGAVILQTIGGVTRRLQLQLRTNLATQTALEALFLATNGFNGGLVVTDDTHPNTAGGIGVAYGGVLTPGADLPGSVVMAGPQFATTLDLELLSYGVAL